MKPWQLMMGHEAGCPKSDYAEWLEDPELIATYNRERCTCHRDEYVAAFEGVVEAFGACQDLYLVLQQRPDTCRLLNALDRLNALAASGKEVAG